MCNEFASTPNEPQSTSSNEGVQTFSVANTEEMSKDLLGCFTFYHEENIPYAMLLGGRVYAGKMFAK